MAKETILSPSFSFTGWNLWEFLKGRKKTAVTVIATVLGYYLTQDFPSSVVAGAIVEGAWATIEYWAKKRTVQ